MAQTVNLKVSKVLSDMIEELAKKNRKSVEDYLSEIVRERYKKS
jgi:hypothetical protein